MNIKSNKINLYKIILLLTLLYILKAEGLVTILFVFLTLFYIYLLMDKKENLTPMNVQMNNNIIQILNSIDYTQLRYNYKYDKMKVDELTGILTKLAMEYKYLKKVIELKNVEIFRQILNNKELKTFLEFNNLIHTDGLPIFLKESESVSLANQIKILLIVINKDNFNKIYNQK